MSVLLAGKTNRKGIQSNSGYHLFLETESDTAPDEITHKYKLLFLPVGTSNYKQYHDESFSDSSKLAKYFPAVDLLDLSDLIREGYPTMTLYATPKTYVATKFLKGFSESSGGGRGSYTNFMFITTKIMYSSSTTTLRIVAHKAHMDRFMALYNKRPLSASSITIIGTDRNEITDDDGSCVFDLTDLSDRDTIIEEFVPGQGMKTFINFGRTTNVTLRIVKGSLDRNLQDTFKIEPHTATIIHVVSGSDTNNGNI